MPTRSTRRCLHSCGAERAGVGEISERLDLTIDATQLGAASHGRAMPGVGLEPTSSCERRLLRPLPLPIWAPGPPADRSALLERAAPAGRGGFGGPAGFG